MAVIQEWLAEPEVVPRSLAVLTRVNSLLLAPQVALAEAGVPLSSVLRAEVLVWSFVFGDQIPQQQFAGMTLRRPDGSARPAWDRWLAIGG